MKRYLFGVAAALLGTALVSVTGLHTAAAADPSTSSVTLPLFGAPLTLDITTGPGGAISDVSLDNADAAVATVLKPHKVVFKATSTTDPTDTERIVIKSRFGGQSVSARAGSLGDVSGPGAWNGDVFGTGTTTSVNFTIGTAADGVSPDITGVTSSDATAVIGATQYSSHGDDGHEGDDGTSASARASVKFLSSTGDQSRVLTIAVRSHTGDEHSGAKLSISLSPIKGVAVDATAAAGPHAWSGTLCDGSTATVNYTVAADGTVSDVTATPDTATVRADGGKIWAKFSNHEWVGIRVRENDGTIKISAVPMIWCDSAAPTTNAQVDPNAPQGGDGGHDGGWGHGHHKNGMGGFGFRNSSHKGD